MTMKRILREPLLHFVVLGLMVFAFDAFVRERSDEVGGGEIVVSHGRIENLAALFVKTWQRPPTAEELRGLVDEYVLEEALYREGLALGVDQDDTIIRRRVRQKMEFVVDDVVEVEPTEAELEAWLAEHAQSYASPTHFSFRQVYLNPERRAETLRIDAERALADLRSTADPSDPRTLGDSSLLEHAYADAGADVVAGTFGQAFADHLAAVRTGEWSGPVESAFGLHLVFVGARTEGRLPALAEVRGAVARDWSYAQREEASKDFYKEVLARYRVTVEWSQDDMVIARAEPSEEQQ